MCGDWANARAAHYTVKSRSAIWGRLTMAVELTQLTGLRGLYACAYRQFNVDDLILNALGAAVGLLVGRDSPNGRHVRSK